jgi:1-acyl-sn-glycerol-3-phosphate acyltransferase
MAELVYPLVIALIRGYFKAIDLHITVTGAENIPATGGAVIASNHVSYLDFTFVGYGAGRAGRLVRFMAKDAVFRHRVSGPLMRGMKHIPVDRSAGSGAFREAMAALKNGEVVGVFPEATISRSFVLKEFKPGAVRMAQAAAVPIVPVAVWGGQRLYTKGKPKDLVTRGRAVTVAFGPPLTPAKRDNTAEVNAQLAERIAALLDEVQRTYPDRPSGPDDSWWLPAALGGTAPTPEQAAALDLNDSDGVEGSTSQAGL